MQRSHPLGVIAIEDVTGLKLRDVGEEEARRAGHESRKALVAFVREKIEGATLDTVVYRITFRFAGDADFAAHAVDAELTNEDADAITASLKRLDEASPRPWTQKTLALIAEHPRVVAASLAAEAGRDRASFKEDVVKLKKLGLTQSFGIGYDVSPRGRAYLSLRKSRSTRARKPGSKTPSTRIE